MEYQRKNGELELPVKSLCDLAREAKGLHLFLLQLELTQQAIEIKADDGWAWIQHGDALLNSGRLEDALEAYQQAETYGEHLFSKTGRAEVLKALGRLDEALGAYDDVIAEHREDVVARNGRASVLATMGRYQEALKGLPSQNPVTQNDWIGYHIRGMVLMLTRHFDAAIQIFEDGVVHDPRPASQDYFRTTLAVAHIRQKEYAKASKVLSEVHSPGLVVPANALRFHTLGALGHRDEATALYSSLRDVTTPIMVDLREELHRRYITNEEPMHSDDWIFNTEIRCLMLAV